MLYHLDFKSKSGKTHTCLLALVASLAFAIPLVASLAMLTLHLMLWSATSPVASLSALAS